MKVAATVQVAGEGATVKVEGATVKVAAAVQVAGGAATVQVAGHCTSGGGPLYKAEVRWVAKRALLTRRAGTAPSGHVGIVRARPRSTGSPNEYWLAQRL